MLCIAWRMSDVHFTRTTHERQAHLWSLAVAFGLAVCLCARRLIIAWPWFAKRSCLQMLHWSFMTSPDLVLVLRWSIWRGARHRATHVSGGWLRQRSRPFSGAVHVLGIVFALACVAGFGFLMPCWVAVTVAFRPPLTHCFFGPTTSDVWALIATMWGISAPYVSRLMCRCQPPSTLPLFERRQPLSRGCCTAPGRACLSSAPWSAISFALWIGAS